MGNWKTLCSLSGLSFVLGSNFLLFIFFLEEVSFLGKINNSMAWRVD